MDLFKRLSLVITPKVLTLCGGVVIFAGLGGSVFAVDLPAPEIDPSAITGAMTLLFGSVMLIAGKCSRK